MRDVGEACSILRWLYLDLTWLQIDTLNVSLGVSSLKSFPLDLLGEVFGSNLTFRSEVCRFD